MTFRLAFTLLAIGVVVAGIIPFGMSQVVEDAYMEIDMLPTQTVNPFSIQDENDVEVFGINTDGHPIYEHPYRSLEFFDTTIHTVNWVDTDITGTSHDGVLKQWSISNPSGNPYHIFHDGGWATSVTRGISGASFCWNEVEYSVNNGDTWSQAGLSWGGTFGVFTPSNDSYYHTEWSAPVTDFRIIQYAGIATTCEMTEYSVVFPVIIPPFLELTEVK